MQIGVDLDGVIVETVDALLPHLSQMTGRTIRESDITRYEIHLALGLTDEDGSKIIEILEQEALYETAEPVTGAIEVLTSLPDIEISFLTGRPETAREQTERWLKRHGLSGIPLRMSLPGHKLEVSGEFHVIVEDDSRHIETLLTRTEHLILYDRPWNQLEASPSRLHRMRDWKELEEILERIRFIG